MGESSAVSAPEKTPRISVELLRVGMYIHLDLGWMEHPFSFNRFKLKNEQQIRTVRTLGLKEVRWSPERSDVLPESLLRAQANASGPVTDSASGLDLLASVEDQALLAAKRARVELLRTQRERLAGVEQAFFDTRARVGAINEQILLQPHETVESATLLVSGMVDALLSAPEVAIQVISGKAGSEDLYIHSLNVMVLAMLLGRKQGLPADRVSLLGLGALFHDVGLAGAMSASRLACSLQDGDRVREQHCRIGSEIAARAGLPPEVQTMILQHHEHADGSGFPLHLKGEQIDALARIVALANHYDHLCNPHDDSAALTPHEALSAMFAQQRSMFDPGLLQIFIQLLGVYPPGTVVRLSNELTGIVVTTNPGKPLKPEVMIYDAERPREDAIILDLALETEVTVSRAIRPALLLPEVYDYLSLRKRVSYYFDAGEQGAADTK